MPTHDYIISNGTGAAVRADINSALSAIVSLNSSASEPATMYAYQLWADTTNGLLKIRNSANSAWITLRQLDGDFSIVAVEDGLQATPSLTFANDLNTGIFRAGNDSLAIITGGQNAIACTSTQSVGIRTLNPSTALHVAGNARVGADDVTDAHLQIGKGATGSRSSYIDIVADTTYTDYGVRFIRNNTGANATSEIKHRGTGNFNITTQEASAIVFSTSNTPKATIDSSGLLLVGATTGTAHTLKVSATEGTMNITDGVGFSVSTGTGGTPNAAATNISVYRNSTTSRSINASGTVNASGADYAEYMPKAGSFDIAKGDICGVDSSGMLTNVFADAVGFLVKSTNPSYVGGDTWGTEKIVGAKPNADEPELLAEWEAALEAERQKVDRIAFAGQVPANVTGATPGQYIVPVATKEGGITGIAKDEADLTLTEYMRAVGKVIAIGDDGRARVIVKVA